MQAVLQAVSAGTATNTVTAPVTPIPSVNTLIGTPTSNTWVAATDLVLDKVKYGYLVFQTYNAVGGGQGLASVTGTTDWISTPDISSDFPNVSVSATATSVLAAGVVTFTIVGNVAYTKTTPGIYDVALVP